MLIIITRLILLLFKKIGEMHICDRKCEINEHSYTKAPHKMNLNTKVKSEVEMSALSKEKVPELPTNPNGQFKSK